MSTGYESDIYLSRQEMLDYAVSIAEEFHQDGMDITLRQLYYQFVSRGLTGSGQAVYKRLGDVVTAARYSGEFPLDQLVDRGRDVAPGAYTRTDINEEQALADSDKLIRAIPSMLLNVDRWAGQKKFVSVWVEKQALEGVFQPECDQLGVSWFACKGYPSVSALWQWLQRAREVQAGYSTDVRVRWPGGVHTTQFHLGTAEECVVLYFGDHDPDGWEIPRSAERNIRKLMALRDINLNLRFQRVALNMDQIAQHKPPPFEAKVSSARYAGYIKEHKTQDAWELDALNPRELRRLIRREVEKLFDPKPSQVYKTAVTTARERLRQNLAIADRSSFSEE